MGINKNFVVKNGLEVDENLIYADGVTDRVGIGTTNPQYTLDVNGDVGAVNINTINLTSQNSNLTGITTVNNVFFDGYLSVGNTTGKDGQVLVSTGIGITWSKLSKRSIVFTASSEQDTFYFDYDVGSVEIYINGVRLAPNEFEAIDGSTIVINDPCFGGETVEILATQTLPTGLIEVPIGITVQEEGSVVGTAESIRTLNFIGEGVTATAVGSQQINVTIDAVLNPPGKTYYVSMNGDDNNSGLTIDIAKKTIKSAAEVAIVGDTIKVSAGTYVEDNPIILGPDISIEGAELRNCIVTPQNPGSDLFWVSNGNHLTDLSFQGQTATNGSSVVAFKPLLGVSSDRYFDAARMIRYNLNFIASEAVGFLTSVDYPNGPFTLNSGDYTSCKDDIKDIFRAICHDITRGGNSKCVGAGLSYYDESTLQHIVGVKTETIDTIQYAAGIAVSCINNVLWEGNYQTNFTQLRDLSIQADDVTGSNTDINSCSNVISAVYSCVGVVTTIIDQGPSVVGTSFNLTYPGNSGLGTATQNDDLYPQGVGNVVKGPYIRNCTNFIPGSIGMKVDGFNADPGDKDDMGITGMMSVDSYTQYNQGGIGVSITNGAYAQLVSIFTICDDIAIYTASGGQCDITNSNSSFGTKGLVSEGVSSPSTKSNYRYTAGIHTESSEGNFDIVLSQLGNERPYSGQVIYFGELYYQIDSVTITNGGSGYTQLDLLKL